MKTSGMTGLAILTLSALAWPALVSAQPEEAVLIDDVRQSPPPLQDVTFLGVSTHGVDAALASQLDLPPETGLVVVHILSDSPAAGILKEHDLLTRFDDQILIEPRQLGVLVRSRKEGDEVKLTFFRGGKSQTVKVKLAKRAMPPLPAAFVPGTRRRLDLREEMPLAFGRTATIPGPSKQSREMRIARFEPKDSVMVFDDGSGRLELNFKSGKKHLTARDAKGKVIFDGPVATPEERKALPAEVKARLEKMESTDVRIPAPPGAPEPSDLLRELPGAGASAEPGVIEFRKHDLLIERPSQTDHEIV